MKTTSYEALTLTTQQFLAFAKKDLNFKRDLNNSWIEKALEYVKGLSKTLNDDSAQSYYLSLNNQNSECLWSLIQLQELKFVYDNLIQTKRIDIKNLKPKLKKIIKAPFLPCDETEDKNEPKNILFELILLGELLNRGFDAKIQPSVSDHPDIEVIVNKNIYAIECKRIFKAKTFIRNFNRAKIQLQKYSLNQQKFNYGIIAINVVRVFNKGDKLLLAQNEQEANGKAFNELRRLFNQFENKLHKNYDSKIPALFLYLSTPMVLENQRPFLTRGHYLLLCELSDRSQISLFHLVKSDFARLNP